jgi:hypothetical protein
LILVPLRPPTRDVGAIAFAGHHGFFEAQFLGVDEVGRFNAARIVLEDQLGSALNGNETFNGFNPIIGGTYKITPGLTAYAGSPAGDTDPN